MTKQYDQADNQSGHIPVLLAEVLAVLQPQPGDTVLDCTTGRGGHSAAFARAVGTTGCVIGMDIDAGSLAYAVQRIAAEAAAPFEAVKGDFRYAAALAMRRGWKVDVVLADLGFSSNQMDNPSRGLSFAADGPLDMRLDPDSGATAAELIARLPERELANLIYQYGEEPLSRKIARKLVQTRQVEPILRTAQLADLVREAYGPRAMQSRMHPATRTFMALRIAVNDELGALDTFLDQIRQAGEAVAAGRESWIRPGARIGIISFHSLEDRRVKQTMAAMVKDELARPLTKKPIEAADDELAVNARARSAKLRAIELVGGRSK